MASAPRYFVFLSLSLSPASSVCSLGCFCKRDLASLSREAFSTADADLCTDPASRAETGFYFSSQHGVVVGSRGPRADGLRSRLSLVLAGSVTLAKLHDLSGPLLPPL